DSLFSATAEWRGKRHARPWSGRVWPVSNSHIVEALGRWATADQLALRRALVHLLRRFVHMMFSEGDVTRPNCYEHYNPFTGAPSAYRGIDDHQRSWVVDLIIQYVCGLRPHRAGLTVDPLPFNLELAELKGATIAGRSVSVRVERDGYEVQVDDERYARPLGEPLRVLWPPPWR
ncbi:MAG: MGH1-like glycoside hydrolase domain-containing protein, partial [Gemmatimonadaceae bacterium]